ncbi:unnamed protein product, partial [Symbiodinium pilosum]
MAQGSQSRMPFFELAAASLLVAGAKLRADANLSELSEAQQAWKVEASQCPPETLGESSQPETEAETEEEDDWVMLEPEAAEGLLDTDERW